MKITVQTRKPGVPTGDLFGIFFEDINHAADGGLYPELVQNRSFEYLPLDNPSYEPLTAWKALSGTGEVVLSVQTGGAVSEKNPHYLCIDVQKPGAGTGVMNLGFAGGMYLEAGAKYRLSFYAKREQDLDSPVEVSLVDEDGYTLTARRFDLTTSWKKHETTLVPVTGTTQGKLVITVEGRGKVYLDHVSLMPADTFKGLPFRKDIAEKLAELKPKFLRFPGGCLVHEGALDPDARDSLYRWKNTIGPVEARPSRRNNWNYNQSMGLGFYEYFLLAEAIGSKPVPVISAGYNPHHHRAAPLSEMEPWVRDALDLIEFARGDESTVWGSKRIELGHEEPFDLQYLGIGNEEVGEDFFDRYTIIASAVREQYPDIRIIGTAGFAAAGGEFERGWKHSRQTETDLVDEHYYMAPEWFVRNHDRYASYDPKGPKVFLGEYASWGNTWYNALAEASYMIGLEENANIVKMACYAPLLCNVDEVNWKPDLIWYNNHQTVGTANYEVQKRFMHHQGERTVPVTMEDVEEIPVVTADQKITGDLRLGQDESTVLYTNILARNLDTGEIRTYPDTQVDAKHPLKHLDNLNWPRYTVRMKARELSGKKGFKIYFGWKSDKEHMAWSLGGWQNQDMFVTEVKNGVASDLSHYLFAVEKGRDYDLTLRVDGRHIITNVDGEDYHQLELPAYNVKPLYVSAASEGKEIIVKAVNLTEQPQTADIDIDGMLHLAGEKITLSAAPDATNTFEEPNAIREETEEVAMKGDFIHTFPPLSLTIFRLHEKFLDS